MTTWRIIWRVCPFVYVSGISRYSSEDEARTQARKFQQHWPLNRYYVVPA